MTLPKEYQWLDKEPSPKILKEALKLYGVVETPGTKNNPTIMAWAATLGTDYKKVYNADSIPWCGLFMGYVCHKAGVEVPKNVLWALSWSAWGTPKQKAELGDVLVFKRDGGGHVGIYVGENATHYYVLGGNQSDSVNITKIVKTRLYAIRETEWKIAKPSNIRSITLNNKGPVSTNEA